jgi:methylenetetrahydrofolate reductase (NADPH)
MTYQLTAELTPPKGSDISRLVGRAQALKGWVNAINIPDCQRAILKLSSLVAAYCVQQQADVPAIWQLTCRDRNLIALQADCLGAAALGITNVLALTGDPVQSGDQAELAKPVFHLDSVKLLGLLTLLNQGLDAHQVPLKQGGTNFRVGSALNANKLHSPAQQARLRHKLSQGVQFFQTQPLYSVAQAEQLLSVLHQQAQLVGCPVPQVLLGIMPPASVAMANKLNQTVAGISIPEGWIAQLGASDDPVARSLELTQRLVQQLRGVADGFHLMPVMLEPRIMEIVATCFPESQPTAEALNRSPLSPLTGYSLP